MTFEGDLKDHALVQVMQGIAALESNGILTVQGVDDIVAVSFLKGAIVSADALNQTVEDGLGKVLESEGLITDEDFVAVSREHQGGAAGSLGDLLVSRELISRQELLNALRVQTYELMLLVLSWTEGEHKFYGGDEVSFEEGFVPISVDELLIRSIEDLRGEGGLKGPVPDAEGFYRQVPPWSNIQILGRDGDGSGGGIWISSLQRDLLSRLDGKTGAAVIAEELGLGSHSTLFALYNLLRFDLIEHLGAQPRSKAAARGVGQAPLSPASSVGGAPAPTAPAATPGPAALRPSESGGVSAPVLGQTASAPSTLEFESFELDSPADPSTPAIEDRDSDRLQAEIFLPPEPGAEEEGERVAVAPKASPLHRYIGPALAAFMLLVLVLAVGSRPMVLLMPFPWQENQRSTVERHLRQTLFLKIERATRAFFLAKAHYPDSLQELVDLGLLVASDLEGPAGLELSYSTNEVGYRIDMLARGEVIDGLGTTEAIREDIMLNPGLLRSQSQQSVPLYLLD